MNKKDSIRQIVEIGNSFYISIPKQALKRIDEPIFVRIELANGHIKVFKYE